MLEYSMTRRPQQLIILKYQVLSSSLLHSDTLRSFTIPTLNTSPLHFFSLCSSHTTPNHSLQKLIYGYERFGLNLPTSLYNKQKIPLYSCSTPIQLVQYNKTLFSTHEPPVYSLRKPLQTVPIHNFTPLPYFTYPSVFTLSLPPPSIKPKKRTLLVREISQKYQKARKTQ